MRKRSHYRVCGYGGIAFWVMGWETEPDEETEWTGYENRTGRVVVRMVGDDRNYIVEESDITPIERKDYCSECGQIGCSHDGYPRDED